MISKWKSTMRSEKLMYVGFWPRIGASIIDLLLQLAVTIPLTLAIYGRISKPGTTFLGLGDIVVNWILPAAAIIAFWIYKGATPGKMAISARIVDADTGLSLTPMQSIIRYIGYFVSLIPLGVGVFWIGFDRRKQGWHDKMANSVVIRPGGEEPVRFRAAADWRDTLREPN
jgi:uncharacterized RDD family membrane protein YckC